MLSSPLTTCCHCAVEVILDTCGGCGALTPLPEFRQRGVRLNTGAEHAIAFSSRCLGTIRPSDWARTLENNLRVFEAAWALKNVPEDQRAKHRAEMATWRILGWADEVSAMEAMAR